MADGTSIFLLINDAEVLQKNFRLLKNQQVSSKSARSAVQEFTQQYFSHVRMECLQSYGAVDLAALDGEFQDLLRCTQVRSRASKYVASLKSILRMARELHIVAVTDVKPPVPADKIPDREQRLIDALNRFSPTAALSFRQGLQDLNDPTRVSWRGPAVEFRESLREVLDQLAPDKEVMAVPGYKQEKDLAGPTMKQKAIFILRSRQKTGPQMKSVTDNVDVIEERIGGFVRSVYQRSSTATHVAPTKLEANLIREYVSIALMELLEITHIPK